MARRPTAPASKPDAVLTPEQCRRGATLLSKRLEEVRALDISNFVKWSYPQVDLLNAKIDDSLAQVFGTGTTDYERFSTRLGSSASMNMMNPTPPHQINAGWIDGREDTAARLTAAIETLKERSGAEAESPEERAQTTFKNLNLHPQIADASADLFANGHYANAVEDACKALDMLVKMKSKKSDLSGTELMQNVFSSKAPVLKFNDLQSESDRSEQQGMMFLYSGVMLAFRNRRAHELIEDDPEIAMEYIAFISLLAKLLDKAQR